MFYYDTVMKCVMLLTTKILNKLIMVIKCDMSALKTASMLKEVYYCYNGVNND